MNTIWKFPLRVEDRQTIAMPAGAKILTVQAQAGVPCLWALVDPGPVLEPVEIRIHGTGHVFDATGYVQYIGTFQVSNGAFVFHVFRKAP